METPADFSQQRCSCDASSRCWCVDCDEALCDACVSDHRRVTVTRSHRILNQPAGGAWTPPTKFCRLHPSEPLKLYCFTCHQLTCRDCQLTAHMSHRYQFIKEALDSLRKQLEDRVCPIRAQGEAVRRSLLDMETRLQDIAHSECLLRTQLLQSFRSLTQHLKTRMEDILTKVTKVTQMESRQIQRRMTKMKQVQQIFQAVTETAEKARNSSDLSALSTYSVQVESQLKELPDQDWSPPHVMSELKVVADRTSVEAILNFGDLEVLWVPFSVSQTSNETRPACTALLQTSTTSVSPVPDNQSSESRTSHSSIVTPTTSTCPGTLPQTGISSTSRKSLSNHLSPLSSSGLSVNQSNSALASAVQHSSSTSEGMVLKPVQPSLDQPAHQNLSHTQSVSQGSYIVMLQFPNLLVQQKSLMGNIIPRQYAKFTPTTNPPPYNQHPNTNAPSSNQNHTNAPSSNQNHTNPPSSNHHPNTNPPSSNHHPNTNPPSSNHHPTTNPPSSNHHPNTNPPSSNQNHTNPPSSNHHLNTNPPSSNHHLDTNPPSSNEHLETNPPSSNRHLDTNPPSSNQNHTNPPSYNHHPNTNAPASNQHLNNNSPSSNLNLTNPPSYNHHPNTNAPSANRHLNTNPPSSNQHLNTNPPSCDQHHTNPPSSNGHLNTNPTSSNQHLNTNPPSSNGHLDTNPPSSNQHLNTNPPFSNRHLDTNPPSSNRHLDTNPPSSNRHLDTNPRPSCLDQQQSPVVKAVADSACDCSVQQVAVRHQEPSENEPTSTVSEEPAEKPFAPEEPEPEVSDSEDDKPSSVIGHQGCSLSQWQPSVSLFRLPVSPSPPGRPLPCFHLVPGDAEDEIYLKEMSEDSQSHDTDDIFSEQSSPLATLVMVACSACRSANSSIICSFCGRGYHRACHLPPVGPDIRSEWMCSLCQDLSDPSDPFRSDRPQIPDSPCLSLQDQRRCETLLLYLTVEGSGRLPQSQLAVMSERLCRSPSYQSAAEFLSDIWSLFKGADAQDDSLLKLRQNLRHLWTGRSGPEVRNADVQTVNESVDKRPEGSKVKMEEKEVAKLRETKKRLRAFLNLRNTPRPKRMKTDKMSRRSQNKQTNT